MRSSLIVALLLCSCSFPTVMPEALNTEFKPTGEVLVYNRTVSFDAVRVRSPECNLSKRTDGSWGGTLNQRPIDVNVYGEKVRGVDFTMTREQSDPTHLVITGQFQGRIYRFELDDQKAMIRGPSASMNYPGRQVSPTQTTYGGQGNFQLRGEAGIDNPPWPQIGFAFMAMMH